MKLLKIAGLVLTIIVVLLISLCWVCRPHQPSDSFLEEQFNRHQGDLERIIQMMDEDWQMSRIAPAFTWRQDSVAWPRPESEWGISKERWHDYRDLFRKVGAEGGTTRRQKSSDVIIDVWSWGIVPAGIGVGYLHCGQPRNGYVHVEEPCMSKQDSGSGMHGGSTSYGYRYKKIAQDWYIYEESN